MCCLPPLESQFSVREQRMVRGTQYLCMVQRAEWSRGEGGGGGGLMGVSGWISPNPSWQECPLDVAGNQCPLPLVSNVSYWINLLLSLRSCKLPTMGVDHWIQSWSCSSVCMGQWKMKTVNLSYLCSTFQENRWPRCYSLCLLETVTIQKYIQTPMVMNTLACICWCWPW